MAPCLGAIEVSAPRVAHADVDSTGSWQLTFAGIPSTQNALFAQSGTNLSVVLGLIDGRSMYSGSIDPTTGSFSVFATLPCAFTTTKKGWRFSATTPVGGAITSVKLRVKDGTGVTFKVAGKHVSLPPLPGSLPVRATLVLDPPQSMDRCVETPFPGPPRVVPSCTVKRDGTQLTCR